MSTLPPLARVPLLVLCIGYIAFTIVLPMQAPEQGETA